MTEKLTLEQRRSRADEAKRIIRNELVVETFERLRAHYMLQWEATAPDDIETREACWNYLKVMASFREHFEAIIADGMYAVHEIKSFEAKAKN